MTELAAAGNCWRGPAVPDGIDALMHSEQLGEDAAIMKSGPAGLATPVRRRDAHRESPACRPKQPAERTGVQVNGRLFGQKLENLPRERASAAAERIRGSTSSLEHLSVQEDAPARFQSCKIVHIHTPNAEDVTIWHTE